VTYIGRTETHGGAAGTDPCTSGEKRVPYTAKYSFYNQQTMTNIHHVAAEGFALAQPAMWLGAPTIAGDRRLAEWRSWAGGGKTALDLAAGTGKFSPRLLATGAHVIAVEPVREMLDQLIRQFPQIDARTGSAQHIPLDDASLDAVVCAQAFHWFSTPEALREIHRVLKPAVRFGLVWNVRDDNVPWVAALTRIMKPLRATLPGTTPRSGGTSSPPKGLALSARSDFPTVIPGRPRK